MAEDETQTSTRPSRSILVTEAFLAGFASTVGMMAAFAAYQNRDRIRAAVRMLAAG
jgi:hypothetical protein